ncbi:MAG: alpha/beta fold hydrolase [Solirubrobacteraceae bacterium]
MRRRAHTPALAVLLPVLLLVSLPASSSASSLGFGPCATGTEFSCTTLAVPLDRTGKTPGTVTLSVERRLAGAAARSRNAVVALAGGPGQAATPLAEFIAQAISPALSTRDLIVFDQRGTGASGALSCVALDSSSTSLTFDERTEHCARELGAARGDYTTSESVADIEALRQAGGYEKLVLYGTSYGTKVALDYAERYPQNVEALVLDSTETPTGPEAFHVSTFKAMTPALRELCTLGACSGITKTPVADVARLVARLSVRAQSGPVYLPNGKAVSFQATASQLYELLLAGDLNPVVRAETPAAVHAALNRDPALLLRLLVLAGTGASFETSNADDEALFDATSCEETPFPWARAAPLRTRELEARAALESLPTSDFYPFDPEAGLRDQTIPLCIAWPDAAPPPPAEAPLPDVPTLILSGGQDLRTPTENARAVAALIPDAQVLSVPYTGHSVIGSDLTKCSQAALTAFFSSAPVLSCRSTKDLFPPAPIAPGSLSALTPTSGVQGTPGRTLEASIETIRDLRRTVVLLAIDDGKVPAGAHFGGLRGGDAKVTSSSTVLHRFSYVPGVQLSGTIPNKLLLKGSGSPTSLSIGGATAATGRLRIGSGGRIVGTLGGRRIAVTISTKASSARQSQAASEWPAPSVSFGSRARARLR